MAVLECLRQARGEVVTRDQLFESVWPGGVVSDATLTQCIAELRRAFGDSAQTPRVIKTIPKVGFWRLVVSTRCCRFVAGLYRPGQRHYPLHCGATFRQYER
jgi:DNA-binding winged helix-turn-helix (wHTH) protein